MALQGFKGALDKQQPLATFLHTFNRSRQRKKVCYCVFVGFVSSAPQCNTLLVTTFPLSFLYYPRHQQIYACSLFHQHRAQQWIDIFWTNQPKVICKKWSRASLCRGGWVVAGAIYPRIDEVIKKNSGESVCTLMAGGGGRGKKLARF